MAGQDRLPALACTSRSSGVASPNRADMSLSGPEAADSPPVILTRTALLMNRARQADDITVRLRRQTTR
jgi:hypothetical protein